MPESERQLLEEELRQFRKEKEEIRKLVGRIGGSQNEKQDKIINFIFVAVIIIFFTLSSLHYLIEIPLPFPAMFLLEIGLLLVSLKIIWMMHKQSKVEHFQFWILNSIEFRLNDIAKRIRAIEKHIVTSEKDD
jgi:uncharacterized membrane protein